VEPRADAWVTNHSQGFEIEVCERKKDGRRSLFRPIGSARQTLALARTALRQIETPAPRSLHDVPKGFHHFHFDFVVLDSDFIALHRRIEDLGLAGDYFNPFGHIEIRFEDLTGYVAWSRQDELHRVGVFTPNDDAFCRELHAAVGMTSYDTPTSPSGPWLDWQLRTDDEAVNALETIRQVERRWLKRYGQWT
jgi:hypothetical protein